MRGYNKTDNIKEPLILESEDWTEEEYKTLRKLFGCPEGTTRIKVTYSTVEWFEERVNENKQKKYIMIITSEDERYDKECGLDFFTDNPWEGLLEEVVFGDNFEELYGDGHNEGLFYQLYHTETGKRIGYGTLDPDLPEEDIRTWEKYCAFCTNMKYPVSSVGYEIFMNLVGGYDGNKT